MIDFTWTSNPKAIRYYLYYNYINDFSTAQEKGNYDTTSMQLWQFIPNTEYYFWVRAMDAQGRLGKIGTSTKGTTQLATTLVDDVYKNATFSGTKGFHFYSFSANAGKSYMISWTNNSMDYEIYDSSKKYYVGSVSGQTIIVTKTGTVAIVVTAPNPVYPSGSYSIKFVEL